MAEFYIVPPRLIVGSFDRANVVTSINNLRGDLTFTGDLNNGISVKISGNNIQYSTIPGFFVKRSGDTMQGNLSMDTHFFRAGNKTTQSAPGLPGQIYWNTSLYRLEVWNDNTSAWEAIGVGGGGGGAGVFVTSLAPSAGLSEGDLWWNNEDGSFNIYYIDENLTSQWVEVSNSFLIPGSVSVTATNDPGTKYLSFVDTLSGSGASLLTDVNLTYDASSNLLKAGSFSGSALSIVNGSAYSRFIYSGSARTTYTLPSNTPQGTGTSVLSSTIDGIMSWVPMVATGNGNANIGYTVFDGKNFELAFYFQNGTGVTGSSNLHNVGTGLSILYGTNSFSSKSGALTVRGGLGVTGNIFAEGDITAPIFRGNLIGTATTSNNVSVSSSGDTSSNHFILFSRFSNGVGIAISSAIGLSYNPSTGVLIGTTFQGDVLGNLSGNAKYAHESGFAITANYSNHSGFSSTSDLAKYAHESGFASTSDSSKNISVILNSNSVLNNLVFTPSTNSSSGAALSIASFATINPSQSMIDLSTGKLAASGVTIGSADSTISTAQNDLILTSATKNVKIQDNLTILGDLQIFGDTVSIGSTITTILDPVFVLGAGIGGTNPTVDDGKDRGIEFRYYNSGTAKTGFFGYDNSSGKFQFIPNASGYENEIYSGVAGTIVANIEGIASTSNYAFLAGNAISTDSVKQGDKYQLGWYSETGIAITGSGSGLTWSSETGLLSLYGTNSQLAIGHSNTYWVAIGATAPFQQQRIGILLENYFDANPDDFETKSPTIRFLSKQYDLNDSQTKLAGWDFEASTDQASQFNGVHQLNLTSFYNNPSNAYTMFSAYAKTDGPGDFVLYGSLDIQENYAAVGSYVSVGTTLYFGSLFLGPVVGIQKSPASTGATTYTLPVSTPQSGLALSVLSSSPSGIMSWVSLSQYGLNDLGNQFQIPYYYGNGIAITGSPNFTNIPGFGVSIVNPASNSSSTTSGALVVIGGVGITGNLNVGGTITAPTFLGNLSGTSTTSSNINLVATDANNAHRLVFTPSTTTASGAALSINSTLLYNPSIDRLFVSGLSVTSSVSSTTTSTGALIVTGGLGISGQITAVTASFGFTNNTTTPVISFFGTGNTSPITLTPYSNSSLAFEGYAGQLFGIDNNLTEGEIFSVNDVSGLAIISASAGHTILLNQFDGLTRIGNGQFNSTSSTTGSLVVIGGVGITGNAFIGGTVSAPLFVGNFSGSAATVTNFYGTLNGTATTSTNINLVSAGSTSSNHFLLMSRFATGTGVAISSAVGLSYNPSTGVLIGTTFQGDLSGTSTASLYANQSGFSITSGLATTARNIDLLLDSNSSSNKLVFTPSTNTSSGAALSIASFASIEPSTSTISLSTGKIVANEVTVGHSANTISSNNDLILTSSNKNVQINDNLTVFGNIQIFGTTTSIGSTISTLVDPVLVLGSAFGGTNPTFNDNKDRGIEFRYFSSTAGVAKTGFYGFDNSSGKFIFLSDATGYENEIYSGTAGTIIANFEGNLIGLATTSSYSYESGFAITSGLATSSIYSNQSGFALTSGLATTSSYSYESGFAITSGLATTSLYSNQSGFASTSGLATTSVYSYESGFAITSGLATTSLYSYESGFAITSGLATTSLYSHESGFATTSGIATSSINIFLRSSTADTEFYLVFSNQISGSGVALSAGSGLTYNSATNIFTAQNIQGTILTANQQNITGLGIISSGTWSASAITSYYGGTGYSNIDDGDLLVGSGGTWYKLPKSNTSGQVLTITSSAPYVSWQNVASGTAASSIEVGEDDNSNIDRYLTFVENNGSGIFVSIDKSGLKYNPQRNSITVGSLIASSIQDSISPISGSAVFSGGIGISKSVSIGGTLYIYESTGSSYIGFKSGNLIGSTIYILPNSTPVGIANSVLQSTPSGILSWVPMTATGLGGGAGTVDLGELYSVAYYPSAGTLVTGPSNFKYNPTNDIITLGNITVQGSNVGSNDAVIKVTGLGNGKQLLSTWSTLNSGLALDASNASLRIVGDTNTLGTLVDFGVYDNSGFPTGNWNSKYLFNTQTSAIFRNGLDIRSLTNSTSVSSGAFINEGGIGISGNAFIGGTITAPLFTGNISAIAVTATDIYGTLQTGYQPNITAVGIVTSGNWKASAIATTYGGTGFTSYNKGDILAGTADSLLSVQRVGTNGLILKADSNSSTGITWQENIIGNPDDTTYTDGFFDTWTNNTKVSNAMDDINELLKLIAPAKPTSMSGLGLSAISRPTYYTVRIAGGLGTEWYQAGYGTGDQITTYYLSGAHTLSSPNIGTAFQSGTLITSTYGKVDFLKYNSLYPSGFAQSTIDLTVNYVAPYDAGDLRLTALDVYNNIWTKANARIDAYTQITSGYEGFKLSHDNNIGIAQTTNTYEVFRDLWSNSFGTPYYETAATATTFSQSLKYLSGISYYGTGTGFSVYFKTRVGIYSSCYNSTQIFAVTATGLATSRWSPSTPPLYDDVVDRTGNNEFRVSLDTASQSSFGQSLTVTIYKAAVGTSSSNAAIAKPINTYSGVASSTDERFQDELYRKIIDSDTSWVSTDNLTNGNLQVRSGTLRFPVSSDYVREYGSSPSFTGDQEYQRHFWKESASTGSITFTGVPATAVSSYGSGNLNVLLWLERESGKYFDLGQQSGGTITDGSTRALAIGARQSASGSVLNWTFGTDSTGTPGNNNRYRLIIIYKNTNPQITRIQSS